MTTLRKASKDYRCSVCSNLIREGQDYHFNALQYKGKIKHYRYHPECKKVRHMERQKRRMGMTLTPTMQKFYKIIRRKPKWNTDMVEKFNNMQVRDFYKEIVISKHPFARLDINEDNGERWVDILYYVPDEQGKEQAKKMIDERGKSKGFGKGVIERLKGAL